jgi:hypothetical protein
LGAEGSRSALHQWRQHTVGSGPGVNVGDNDPRILLRQLSGPRTADAITAAGDDGDLLGISQTKCYQMSLGQPPPAAPMLGTTPTHIDD